MPEGEEEELEIENLFEKLMENFSNLVKEIYFQEVQQVQSPKEVGPKEAHTKAHQLFPLSYPRLKIRRESQKAARKKETVT